MTGEREPYGHLPRDFPSGPRPFRSNTVVAGVGAYAPEKNTRKRGFSTSYFPNDLLDLDVRRCVKAVQKP